MSLFYCVLNRLKLTQQLFVATDFPKQAGPSHTRYGFGLLERPCYVQSNSSFAWCVITVFNMHAITICNRDISHRYRLDLVLKTERKNTDAIDIR